MNEPATEPNRDRLSWYLPWRAKAKFKRLRRRWQGQTLFLLRRVVAVGLMLAAVVMAFSTQTSSARDNKEFESSGEETVISARDLPAGVSLTPEDLRVVAIPASLRPSGSFSKITMVTGNVLLAPARAGEPLTDRRLSAAIIGLAPPGKPAAGTLSRSVVPLRLADPAITALLKPGTHVDVVSAASGSQNSGNENSGGLVDGDPVGKALTTDATVITVVSSAGVSAVGSPPEKAQTLTPSAGSLRNQENPLVLIAVPTEISAQVAAASLDKPVTVTLR
jgi:Flp pilus assembly protein CpaB